MKAVNLIPAEQRKRSAGISTGTPFLALMGGLAFVLIAVALFVVAHNRVATRRSQLAGIQARTAQWTSAAGSYSQDVTTAQQRQSTIASVEGLVGQRANWSLLLGQLAAALPAHSQLSSLTASSAGAASSTSTTPTTTTSSTGATTSGSSIQLSACAAAQTVVAETMRSLRHITGVSSVTLASSSRVAGSGGSGGCRYPVSFSVTLAFQPPTFAGGSAGAVTAGESASSSGSSGVPQ